MGPFTEMGVKKCGMGGDVANNTHRQSDVFFVFLSGSNLLSI